MKKKIIAILDLERVYAKENPVFESSGMDDLVKTYVMTYYPQAKKWSYEQDVQSYSIILHI